MKRILILALSVLLLFIGNVNAMDIDVWYVVETHTQDGKIIEKQVIDVYRTRGEAIKNLPKDYTIPGRIERVTIPARTETKYWLIEMQSSGSGWVATGKQKGPYSTRSEATKSNPGTRTERNSARRYYIREMYREYGAIFTRETGKTEGPFASQTAAQNRVNNLGTRVINQTTYTGSLYLDDQNMSLPRTFRMPSLLTRRTFNSLSTAQSEVRALIDRTSTVGTITRSEPLPSGVINLYGQHGLIPSKDKLAYSGYKLVAVGSFGAYVGLVIEGETEAGRYFWEPYTSNATETINYRWDVGTENNEIPERVEEREIPPTSVTYSVEKETVSVNVTIHLTK